MKQYRTLTAIFLILFIGGGVFHFSRQVPQEQKEPEEKHAVLSIVFPEAQSFLQSDDPFPYYKAYKTSARTERDLVGFAFLTTDIAPEIRGYAGPIEILIGMDPQGTIKKAHVLSHSETTSYVARLDTFLEQFISKGMNDPFELGNDIDGITRATITSRAITRAIGESLKQAGHQILQLEAARSDTASKPLPLDEIFVPLILFTIAVISTLTHNRIARWTALIGGFLYFGILRATMISSVQIVNIFLLKFPPFEQSPLWYMLIGLTLLTTFLFGMVFCGHLCPFAAVEEILYNLAHREKKPKKRAISNTIDQRARYMKYVVLFAIIIASALLGNSGAAGIEPFLTLFTFSSHPWGWSLLALMLFAAIFYFRFWCKYFCPVGACLGLIARVNLFKLKLGDGCTHCELCEKVCPTRAIHIDKDAPPKIDHPECVLCGKCVHICHLEKSHDIVKSKIKEK